METIVPLEGKATLSSLLKRVSAGKNITLTRRGAPVARLIPSSVPRKRTKTDIKAAAAVRKMRAFEKRGVTLGGLSLRALRDEGRR